MNKISIKACFNITYNFVRTINRELKYSQFNFYNYYFVSTGCWGNTHAFRDDISNATETYSLIINTMDNHFLLESHNYISLIRMSSNTVHFLLDILLYIFTTIFFYQTLPLPEDCGNGACANVIYNMFYISIIIKGKRSAILGRIVRTFNESSLAT